jgi:hypothetical protein
MTIVSFFSKCKTDMPGVSPEEIILFYEMLLRMKKHHPNLNVNRIMTKLYPNFKLDKR